MYVCAITHTRSYGVPLPAERACCVVKLVVVLLSTATAVRVRVRVRLLWSSYAYDEWPVWSGVRSMISCRSMMRSLTNFSGFSGQGLISQKLSVRCENCDMNICSKRKLECCDMTLRLELELELEYMCTYGAHLNVLSVYVRERRYNASSENWPPCLIVVPAHCKREERDVAVASCKNSCCLFVVVDRGWVERAPPIEGWTDWIGWTGLWVFFPVSRISHKERRKELKQNHLNRVTIIMTQ